ncbi:MAG TPA: adenosylcobinamide-GDP ribazoletransferase [Candidatus Angelobacter sp.]|jgi:adenosylcobinamide-GDP ribazoletransferase|nr:adenosylcobinamide-GDP ribazoletransferase [Candidatus Angelobacter sp.]
MKVLQNFLTAFRFLTRIPLPGKTHAQTSLSGAAMFFPIVGLAIALGAIGLRRVLLSHFPASIVAALVLSYLVLITGGFHEDGLADSADGFGGGWTKDRILEIMRDSRIGSFGALAIGLSLLARYSLLSNLRIDKFSSYIIVAHVLCRWTTLPLSFFMRPARAEGQGAGVAQRTSALSLISGTLIALLICYLAMHLAFWLPLAVAVVVTLISGLYYHSQIGGITGDCFGATHQLTEIGIYLCGVWVP